MLFTSVFQAGAFVEGTLQVVMLRRGLRGRAGQRWKTEWPWHRYSELVPCSACVERRSGRRGACGCQVRPDFLMLRKAYLPSVQSPPEKKDCDPESNERLPRGGVWGRRVGNRHTQVSMPYERCGCAACEPAYASHLPENEAGKGCSQTN